MGKKKNKEDIKKRRQQVENEYLKRLERSLSGVPLYSMTDEEKRRQEHKKRIQKLHQSSSDMEKKDFKDVSTEEQEKETPRIPIEFAIEEDYAPQTEIKERETRTPEPSPPRKPERPAPDKYERGPDDLFDIGAIILLEDGSVGVYKGSIPGKEYHLLYHLLPDGNVRPEGLYIYGYQAERLGCVPAGIMDEIQKKMKWDREQLISHLDSPDKAELIPFLSEKKKETEPVASVQEEAPRKKEDLLERGRKLKVKIGDRGWEAVYWGSDELGQIVAHNTHQDWTLMHLNLGRFGESLELGEKLSPEEIKEINEVISENIAVGE